MSEPTSSNYPASLDDVNSLGNDQKNLKQWVISGNINASTPTIPTTATISGITAPFYIRIGTEIMWVTGISGANFTVVRGADGTIAASHDDGDAIYHIASANVWNQLRRAIIAIETELGIDPAGSFTDLVTRLGKSAVLRVYTANDTWTKPAGLVFALVEVLGAGGGGGGVTAALSQAASAGGGGAGGYSRKLIPAASLGGTEAITVGSGGAGGSAGNNAGATGGTSSFGSHLSATGGDGGAGDAASATVPRPGGEGGLAGNGSGGDINLRAGSPGGNGFNISVSSNIILGVNGGGSGMFGSGGRARMTSGPGTQALGRGAGGSGAVIANNAVDREGGNGGDGVVIVLEVF